MSGPDDYDPIDDLLGTTQDALLEGVREALRGLTPPDDDQGAHLRVVHTDEVPKPGPRSDPNVRVRVIRPASSSSEGTIHLAAGEQPDWQTVYRGSEARLYRLRCDAGVLEIALDGELIEQLHPGQSADLEASFIRVHRGADQSVSGRYARV